MIHKGQEWLIVVTSGGVNTSMMVNASDCIRNGSDFHNWCIITSPISHILPSGNQTSFAGK